MINSRGITMVSSYDYTLIKIGESLQKSDFRSRNLQVLNDRKPRIYELIKFLRSDVE